MVAAGKASAPSNRNPSAQQQIDESCKVGVLNCDTVLHIFMKPKDALKFLTTTLNARYTVISQI